MGPISSSAAMARINLACLTLADAIYMSDADLLRFPSIGRRTLRFIRSIKLTEG